MAQTTKKAKKATKKRMAKKDAKKRVPPKKPDEDESLEVFSPDEDQKVLFDPHDAIPALDTSLATYNKAKNQRIKWGREEKTLKDKVMALMKKHQKTFYRGPRHKAEIVPTDEQLKVQEIDDE